MHAVGHHNGGYGGGGGGGGGASGSGLTFGLSNFLAEKMARTHQLAASLGNQAAGAVVRRVKVGTGSAAAAGRMWSGSKWDRDAMSSSWMVTRCPNGLLAQLNHEGICSWSVLFVPRSWCVDGFRCTDADEELPVGRWGRRMPSAQGMKRTIEGLCAFRICNEGSPTRREWLRVD